MTEAEAKSLQKGDLVTYNGEDCVILRIHKSPVLVECKTVNQKNQQWHMVRPGGVRLKK